MPKVHLHSVAEVLPGVDPAFDSDLRCLRERARRDAFGLYRLTEDPAEADIRLFVESARDDGLAC